jgi:hypothetical protein
MITADQAAIVKGLLLRGEKQHDIAAFFGENGGRIAEIAKGHRHAGVKPAPRKDLPTPADMASGHAVHLARQALIRAKLGIEAAMSFLDDYQQQGEGRRHGQ